METGFFLKAADVCYDGDLAGYNSGMWVHACIPGIIIVV